MRLTHKLISLLLVILTLVSSIPMLNSNLVIDEAYALKGGGSGLGGGKYGGGQLGGVWNPNRGGIRVYMVDKSGNLVSNIVDIVPDTVKTSQVTAGYMAHFQIKTDSSYDGYYECSSWGDVRATGGIKLAQAAHRMLSIYSIGEVLSANGNLSGIPIPVINNFYEKRGSELAKFMLGYEAAGVRRWGSINGGGTGSKETYEDTTEIKYETVESFVDYIEKTLQTKYEIALADYRNGLYTEQMVINTLLNDGNALVSMLKNTTALDETKVYTDEQIAIFSATVESFINKVKVELASGAIKPQAQANTELSSTWLESLIETAYASTETSVDSISPLWENGKLIDLMEAQVDGSYVFKFTNPNVKKILTNEKKLSVMLTCAANEYVIMMEPVLSTRLQKIQKSGAGEASSFAFYGTPHDLGMFLVHQRSIQGGWTQGSGTWGNSGGWVARGTHMAFPYSMFTEHDLNYGSINIQSGESFRTSKGNHIDASTKDRWPSDSDLANGNIGLGLHYYIFSYNGLPRTQTYDNFPDGKPNTTPHPAPDPDPAANIIPLTEEEDPEKYKEDTRNVNIVKVYDTLLLDEDDAGNRILRHDITYTRRYNPGDIDILHEPQYKVVGYFTSKDYYGDIFDWDNNPDNVAPTKWEELQAIITDKTEGSDWEYESVSDSEEGTPIQQSPVKIALYCDCQDKDAIDGEHGKHYHDKTLYVHLVKPETIPETSTWDGTPPGETPPPDPFKKPQTDPETTPDLTPDNPFLIHEIVKVYQVKDWSDWQEGMPEPEWEHKATFYQYPTAPIVTVETEKDYELTEWKVGVGVPNPDDKAKETVTPPVTSQTDWKDAPISAITPFKKGVQPAKVDIRDPQDKKHNTTIYVLLRKEISPEDEDIGDGAIIIQQSQITKAVRTDDKAIANQANSNWGNYSFHYQIGDFSDSPDSHGHSHGLAGYHSCYHVGNEQWVDQDLNLWFHQITTKQPIQVPDGKFTKTDNAVYSGNSNKGIIHKRDEKITINTIQKYDYVGDGKNEKGEELVTVLWRQGLNDKPILAKFKETDITSSHNYILKGVSATNWTDSLSIVDKADRKAGGGRTLENGFTITDLQFSFGLQQGEGDQHGATQCPGCSCHGCHAPIVRDRLLSVTSGGWTNDFQAPVCVRTYKGRDKDVAAQPYGVGAQPEKDIKTGKHTTNNVIQGTQQIKFYPYIRMTYMLNTLDEATKEAQNTDATGYKQDVRKDTYIISEYESKILPNDAVEVGWENPKDGESLLLTSQQWSVHQKAINGASGITSSGWQGRNQVLPGGAIYQLSTPKDSRTTVHLTTYQTVVDDKARQEYLTSTSTLTGDEYTVKKVTEDHLSFVNDAKEILDNLKVVQWVYNPGTSGGNVFNNKMNAYPKDFDETRSGYICLFHNGNPRDDSQTKLSQLDSKLIRTPATEAKYYMHSANIVSNSDGTTSKTGKLADYQKPDTKLSDITSTLLKNDIDKDKQAETSQGDLDVMKIIEETTVYKVFTDTSGNVYMISETRGGADDPGHIERVGEDINAMIAGMKDINADTYDKWSTGGKRTAQVLFDKTVQAIEVNKKLSGDAKEIDDKTRFITNIVTSIIRNRGTDRTAEWVDGPTEGRWYNEAFDGIYLVKQHTKILVGFMMPDTRTSALDAALCPPNKGQSDLYTNAYLSQFTVDSHSDAAIAMGKEDHYIGTFKDTDIKIPDMESMYISKRFFIPNANVMDLN